MLCTRFLVLNFVSDAIYVDLKYDNVFVLWDVVLSVLGVAVTFCVGV